MLRSVMTAILVLGLAGARAAAPANGFEMLQAMRDAYGKKWFTTLTFTQQTTRRGADGKDSTSTWYESIRYTEAKGAELRIDVGSPSLGNGVLYTADSIWVFREGKLTAHRAGGNELIPLIQGVYVQPVARTVAELAQTGVDLSRAVVSGKWNGRAVWIAGASSAIDTTSPQFWVDVENKMVVRAILKPVPSAPLMDMRFEKIVPVAGGWLATRCEFYVDGQIKQLEEYQGWRGNVALDPGLFEAAKWTTAKHWAGTP